MHTNPKGRLHVYRSLVDEILLVILRLLILMQKPGSLKKYLINSLTNFASSFLLIGTGIIYRSVAKYHESRGTQNRHAFLPP